MLIEVNDDFMEEITLLSNSAGVTPGAFLESIYKDAEYLKEVLLADQHHFSTFVKEYRSSLDKLFYYEDQVLDSLNEFDQSESMRGVFKELVKLVGNDIWFLSKLYKVYLDEKSETGI